MSFQAAFPVLIIAASIAFAIPILRRRRGDPASRVFLVLLGLFVLFALVYLPGRLGFHSEGVRAFYRYGNALVLPFVTAVMLHFCLLFPHRSPLLGRRGLPLLLYLPAAALALAFLYDVHLYATRVDVLPGFDQFYTTYGPLGPLFFAVVMGPALLAVAFLALARWRAASPVEARVLDVLLLGIGTLVAFSTVTASLRMFAGVYLPVGESEAAMVPAVAITHLMLRHRILITPVLEDPSDRARRYIAPPGTGYIVTQPRSTAALDALRDLSSHGVPGVVFTRTSPEALREMHGIRRTPLYWLGFWPGPRLPAGYEGSVDHLPDVANAARDFMDSASPRRRGEGDKADAAGTPGGVVLLHDTTYLVVRHGFPAVMDLVSRLKKAAHRHRGIFILHVDPATLGADRLGRLEQGLLRLG